MVHENPKLPRIKKLHYLRYYSNGDATAVISLLEVSVKHYEQVWDVLCERYENPLVITYHYIKALIEQPNATKKTRDSLRKLIDDQKNPFKCPKIVRAKSAQVGCVADLCTHVKAQ